MSVLERVRRLNRSFDAAVRRGGRKRLLAMAGTATAVLLLVVAGTVTLALAPASADRTIEGRTVDAVQAQTIMLAGLSCPVVTGPRLAGVMMAGSGMDFNAAGGVAAMPPQTFRKWAPWPDANVTDSDANIYALAHDLCTLSGETRQAGAKGDAWTATLAAYRSGVPASAASGELPADTVKYVNLVNGYAAWYGKQPGFTRSSSVEPAPTGSAAPAAQVFAGREASSMPDDYAQEIAAAGQHCKSVTPALLAGQLAASSDFNPNLRASTDAMGIAQFLPSMWAEYAPSAKSSPWDPATAIDVLGSTMCKLTHQFAGISGADSYAMALGAFRVGETAVRQAGGVPPIPAVGQFISQVQSNARLYGKDTRLAPATQPTVGSSAKPSTPATQSSSATPGTAPSSSAPGTSTDPSTKATKPAANNSPTGSAQAREGRITGLNGLCIDVPSSDNRDGNALQMWECDNTAAQSWTIKKDGTIRALGKCMDVRNAGTANDTTVQLWSCDNTPAQEWVHASDGTLYSEYSGKCLDAYAINYGWGSHLAIWDCNHQTNQQFKLPS
jgi:ricin-type beta-trefoil lectin protein